MLEVLRKDSVQAADSSWESPCLPLPWLGLIPTQSCLHAPPSHWKTALVLQVCLLKSALLPEVRAEFSGLSLIFRSLVTGFLLNATLKFLTAHSQTWYFVQLAICSTLVYSSGSMSVIVTAVSVSWALLLRSGRSWFSYFSRQHNRIMGIFLYVKI